MTTDMRNLPVRRCSIQCISNHEWGTFGVMEDRGGSYDIYGQRGGWRVLDKSEAVTHWRLAGREHGTIDGSMRYCGFCKRWTPAVYGSCYGDDCMAPFPHQPEKRNSQ